MDYIKELEVMVIRYDVLSEQANNLTAQEYYRGKAEGIKEAIKIIEEGVEFSEG